MSRPFTQAGRITRLRFDHQFVFTTAHAVLRRQTFPVDGDNGFDGRTTWSRAPGGEVPVLDAPQALRAARRRALLDALGYWYPNRLSVSCTHTTEGARDQTMPAVEL